MPFLSFANDSIAFPMRELLPLVDMILPFIYASPKRSFPDPYLLP